MKPEKMAAKVAPAISVVNISIITTVPMFAGRKLLSATATAYEASTGRNASSALGKAARRIVRHARREHGLKRLEHDAAGDGACRDRSDLLEQLADPIHHRDPEHVQHEQNQRNPVQPDGNPSGPARAG